MNIEMIIQAIKPSTKTQCGFCLAFGIMAGLIILRPDYAEEIGLEKKYVFGFFIVFCSLSFANLSFYLIDRLEKLIKYLEKRWALERIKKHRLSALNTLTAEERKILSYLVTRGEKVFYASDDADRAASLLARGLIHGPRQSGIYSPIDFPFEVEDDIWAELQNRHAEFIHPNPNGPKPWRRRIL